MCGLGTHYDEKHRGLPTPAALLPSGTGKTRNTEQTNTHRWTVSPDTHAHILIALHTITVTSVVLLHDARLASQRWKALHFRHLIFSHGNYNLQNPSGGVRSTMEEVRLVFWQDRCGIKASHLQSNPVKTFLPLYTVLIISQLMTEIVRGWIGSKL